VIRASGVVAQVDGLADGLEGDALLGQARDRQRAGDRARRHHQDVVAEDLHVAVVGLDGGRASGVIDAGDPAAEDVAAGQHGAQRHHHVAGLDGTGRGLGQERLVGHVWLRVGSDMVPAMPSR